MSQQVDLEELTRLYDKYEVTPFHGASRTLFFVAISDAFPALRDELVRLREEREQWRMSSVCREYKRQLDEAKGQLERMIEVFGDRSCDDDCKCSARLALTDARAFLASLAGSTPKQYAFTNCEGKKIYLSGDMTMEDMVRAGLTPHLVDKDAVSTDPNDFIHRSEQEQPTQGEVKS